MCCNEFEHFPLLPIRVSKCLIVGILGRNILSDDHRGFGRLKISRSGKQSLLLNLFNISDPKCCGQLCDSDVLHNDSHLGSHLKVALLSGINGRRDGYERPTFTVTFADVQFFFYLDF